MARKLLAVFSMGLITAAMTGCATDQAVFRGQCPTGGCNTGMGMATGACNSGACMTNAGCQNGMCGPMAGGAACQNGMCGPGARHQYGRLNYPFHPVHRNYVDYQVPRNLQYPEPNQPNALVQYPYYTLRGPTDFFYTGK